VQVITEASVNSLHVFTNNTSEILQDLKQKQNAKNV